MYLYGYNDESVSFRNFNLFTNHIILNNFLFHKMSNKI